jgi:hypothetical protein
MPSAATLNTAYSGRASLQPLLRLFAQWPSP